MAHQSLPAEGCFHHGLLVKGAQFNLQVDLGSLETLQNAWKLLNLILFWTSYSLFLRFEVLQPVTCKWKELHQNKFESLQVTTLCTYIWTVYFILFWTLSTDYFLAILSDVSWTLYFWKTVGTRLAALYSNFVCTTVRLVSPKLSGIIKA